VTVIPCFGEDALRSGTTTDASGKLSYFRLLGRRISESDAKNLITRTSPSLEANSPSDIHGPPPLRGPKFHYIFQKSPKLPYRQKQHIRPKVSQTRFIKTHDVTYQNVAIFISQVTLLLHSPQEHSARCTDRCKTQRTVCDVGRHSSVSIANLTGCTVRGSYPGGDEIFYTCPDRPWGPPNLLNNAYRVFPDGKASGARH
jgi:hypothetical protein